MPQVLPARLVIEEMTVHQGHRVSQALLVVLELLVRPVSLVLRVTRVLLDKLELMDPLECRVLLELPEVPGHRDSLDPMDSRVQQGLQEPRDLRERLDLLDQMDLKDSRDHRDNLESMVNRDLPVLQDQLVFQDPQEMLVVQELEDRRELTVCQVYRVFQGIKAPQDRPVTQGSKDPRVLVVPQVSLVRQVTPARLGLRDLRAIQGLQETQDQLDRLVLKVRLDLWEPLERLGPPAPLDVLGVRVLRVSQDLRVTLVLQGHLELQAKLVPSASQDSPVQMVRRGQGETPVHQDLLGTMGLQVIQDHKDHRVLQGSQDLTAHQGAPVSLVLKDSREVLDLLGLRELRGLQAP